MRRVGLLFGLALTAPALAAPPPEGSLAAELLGPHADWVRSRFRPCPTTEHPRQRCWCCDTHDGRPVEVRVTADGAHYEARVTPENWAGAADHWEVMPDEIIVGGNPLIGWGVLWRSPVTGQNFCFAPPGGV